MGLPAPAAAPSEDDLFAQLELALAEEGIFEQRVDHGCTKVLLRGGGVHLCKGAACRDTELNDEGLYVCRHSGIVVGRLAIRDDFSTGRQTGSNDADAHAGEPVGGRWFAKVDMLELSSESYIAADQEGFRQEEGLLHVASPTSKQEKKKQGGPIKRGARCVDDTAPAPALQAPKRQRQARRMTENEEARKSLLQDAEVTLQRLVQYEKKEPKGSARPVDQMTLFRAALKQYLKQCSSNGAPVCLDDVHNIALTAQAVVRDAQEKAKVENGCSALLLKVRMRHLVTSLAVTLWSACCETPYLLKSPRGANSFRPFVCGVLYALKRGISLPNKKEVVPLCPELAAALPALRATARGSQAKALHASSHRGLCTLHRAIASCTPADADRIFATAARICAQLRDAVACKNFDI